MRDAWLKTGPFLLDIRSPARARALAGVSMFSIGLAIAAPAAAQSPQGGIVVGGQAAIAQDATRSTITQRSQRAVIDWRGFDVGASHTVVFDQPGAASATLNRVTSARPSAIAGAIQAPGTVVIQNTAGVLFTGTARIDVGGLVATSQIVDAGRFQATGGLAISGGEHPGARVVNAGEITLGDAGLAALVGGQVENAGAIVARRGTVVLASGTRTTIDLSGDGTVQIAVEGDAADGRVANTGRIDAEGGHVVLTAGGAAGALDAVINTSGVIRATASQGSGGSVSLTGRGAGRVVIAGIIDVSGAVGGGSVTAIGAAVDVAGSARIAAGGGIDGGAVRLGGDYQGGGPLRRAEHLRIDAGAVITADGAAGRGGTVIAWADDSTRFDGTISATGPVAGGLVETSGKLHLGIGPDARVSLGQGGRWLLDPRNVEIVSNGAAAVSGGTVNPPNGSGAFRIAVGSIVSALNGGADVTITTVQPGRDDRGDILLSAALAWTGSGDLTFRADRDATVAAAVTTTAGNFHAIAGDDVEIYAPLTSLGSGTITLEATGATENQEADVRILAPVTATGSGGIVALAQAGSIRIARDVSGKGFDAPVTSTGTGSILLSGHKHVTIGADVRATGTGGVTMTAATGDIAIARLNGNLRISTSSAPLVLEATQGSVLLHRFDQSAASGGNLQVMSDTSDVTITAGTDITLAGGQVPGRWSRVRSGRDGTVALTAGRDITVAGGQSANSAAEIVAGPGGAIDMRAGRAITVQSAGSAASVQALGGASLSMLADTQTWDGTVQAGTGAGDGGDVTLSGAITASVAPVFSLAPDRDFSLLARGTQGNPGFYLSPTHLAVTTGGTGAIDVAAPVTARTVTLVSDERVGLYASSGIAGRLTATGPDDALVVSAGRQFLNQVGTDALALTDTDPDTRWLLYVNTFAGLAGAAPTREGFDLYGRNLVTAPPATLGGFAGNRIVYLQRPTLTLTGDDLGKTYGRGLDVSDAYSVAGLRPGDTLGSALADGPVVTSAGAAADAGVGYSAIVPTATLSQQGYLLNVISGTLTVTPAALRVLVADAARTYGAADPAFSATLDGAMAWDAAALADALTYATPDSDAQSGVGGYRITASGIADPNYAIDSVDGTLTVTPAALRVLVADAARTYGAADPAFSATLDGAMAWDAAALADALTYATPDSDAQSGVGGYRITASGIADPNYAIDSVDGTLTVTPAALRVLVADAARTYGAADPAFSATLDGAMAWDAAALADALTYATPDSDAQSGVGGYRITASGIANPNYAIDSVYGTLTVTPAALRVLVADAARTYGAADPAFSATLDGAMAWDAAALADALTYATPDSDAQSGVGGYRITASGIANPNYTIESVDGRLSVGRAALTVTANDAVQNGVAGQPTFTVSYGRFANGEDARVLGGRLVFDRADRPDLGPGAYSLRPSGLSSDNYAITFVAGRLTILPDAVVPRPDLPGVGVPGVGLPSVGQSILRPERGVPPLTPGDAAFRTTVTEAPPALADTFTLAYSLGEIVQTTPAGAGGTQGVVAAAGDTQGFVAAAGDTQGFVPAAGGTGAADSNADADAGTGSDCGGSVNRGVALPEGDGCTRQSVVESFWTTAGEGSF